MASANARGGCSLRTGSEAMAVATAAGDRPQYMKLLYEQWEAARANLTTTQGDKLLGAMLDYFFEGTERESLPGPARAMFDSMKPSLKRYRRNVLNGMKNRPKAEDRMETDEETEQVSIWF